MKRTLVKNASLFVVALAICTSLIPTSAHAATTATALTASQESKLLKGIDGKISKVSSKPSEKLMTASEDSDGGTYETYLERGVKHLCYSKDDVTWTTDSSSITDYDADQTRSGLFVQLNGITKKNTLSSSTEFALLCKHTFLVGASLGGVTLGYNEDINDMLYVYQDGSSDVDWDY